MAVSPRRTTGASLATAKDLFSMALPNSDNFNIRGVLYTSSRNEQISFDNLKVVATPEPKTTSLLAGILGLVAWAIRRRTREESR